MDDKVQQNLLELSYNPKESHKIMLSMLPEYIFSLCNENAQYYGGVLLFDGLVKMRCGGFGTNLADERMTISGSQVGEMKSLFIKPLERRIREEYVRMEDIQNIKMTKMLRTQHRTPLGFEITFTSGHPVLLDFWLINGMLYVPAKTKSKEHQPFQTPYQNPMPDPLDNLY